MSRKKIKWKNKNKSSYYEKGYTKGFYKSDIFYRMRILGMSFNKAVTITPPTREGFDGTQ